MGYYIDIRPKGQERITRDAYLQRFLNAGLERHFSFFIEPTAELRTSYRHEVFFTGGVITVCEDAEAPAGVVASVRVSWGNNAESIKALGFALLEIAERTDSVVVHPQTQEPLTMDTLETLADHFLIGRKIVRGHLG